ncbi:MAG: hypothetical protein KatS3mg068_0375 [Candidatus Sericytochromatia bacterium]|nr:MAG: hypothetical protein KatS3mg068_0375 [Candidatus Sericytochromatia bacterium]
MNDILKEFQKKYKFKLDKFQIDAINSLLEGNSVLVTAPTGSGKTLIAEFAVFDALDRNLKVIYTTPLKALSNQKYYDFCQEHGYSNVGLLTGDISINPNAPIIVMTTEILRNILYQDIRRLDSVMYVVLDECHYMNDKDRGTVWEEVIIHCPKHILFVALSATISNSQEVAKWIRSIHNNVIVINHDERPVPIKYLYFKDNKIFNIFENNKVNKSLFKELKNNKLKKENPVTVINKLRDKHLLPAIFFVFSRKGCDNRLEFCMSHNLDLTNHEEKNVIKSYIEKIVNDNPEIFHTSKSSKNILKALIYGIATHHAGLIPIIKHTVEQLFQKNLIKVIFATETLAAGINMPARTTVITSLSKRTESKHEILSVNSFTQMTGRAGRRGMDKIGYCLIIDDNSVPFSEAYRLITSPPDMIKSNFTLSYNMICNLIKNFSQQVIIKLLQKSFGQYINNHEIIDMKIDLENQKSKLNKNFSPCKYTDNNILEEMPLLEYNLLQKKIKEQEYKINCLIKNLKEEKIKKINNFIFTSKRGSILAFRLRDKEYPKLGCIVEAYKDKVKGKTKSFAIILTNKGLCKISSDKIIETFDEYKLIKKNEEAINKTIIAKEETFVKDEFNKNIFSEKEEKKFISKIKEDYQNVIDKEFKILDNLKDKLENHKCRNCSILKEHLKEYNKVKDINIRINALKDKIDYYSNMYLLEYKKLLNVLLRLEYVNIKNNDEYLLTTKGEILSYIRSENDLAIAEVLNNGIFDDLNSDEIASILSLFLYEPRKEMRNPIKTLSNKLRNKVSEILEIIHKINLFQYNENIKKIINIEKGIMDIVLLWCNGSEWSKLFNKNELDEGDIIRTFRRIIDILHQLKNIPFISLELTNKFEKAINLLDRDLVSLSLENTILDESSFEKDHLEAV